MTADLHICALSYQLLFSSYFSFFRLGKNVLCFLYFSHCVPLFWSTLYFSSLYPLPSLFKVKDSKAKRGPDCTFLTLFYIQWMESFCLACLLPHAVILAVVAVVLAVVAVFFVVVAVSVFLAAVAVFILHVDFHHVTTLQTMLW